ncbi:sugar kinase [Mycolicibacterium neworleansense]|uniref:PfkB-family protein carbohydrate kinase n=1 Tax=Mycolicibacterium neworleansense TaxID=146018 RepID=A0A0H5RHI7_9MYCO|nr:sugar kinase [Mycolicibacterium neworleansense]MCV7362140.1 sugar kinase [Mycolicibacterium neworleansense]CRZ13453.1 PfkB-family protein carbohydrate kinase [Mycolicibacterium neworleansense]
MNPTFDVVTVGESLGLLTAPQPGRLHHNPTLRLGFGGAESNVAIGVARLGGTAAWIGRLGADSLGELILRELRAEGVHPYPVLDLDTATALMIKERPHPGATRVSYYRRGQAGSRLRPADVPIAVVADTRILHVTGISAALGESARSAAHAAIDAATSAGASVSFDVNHRSALWSDQQAAAAAYLELAQRADIVFAGEAEAQLLTGADTPRRQLDALLSLGIDCAVLKRGAEGAMAATTKDRCAAPAVAVPVIDTVGAGDAFVAGWLAELARGATLRQCLDTALACGAFACTGDGDWESAPSRDDLQWLRRGPGDPVSR